jgi:hypothetical protein
MRYTVTAINGRKSMEGTTTQSMWLLLKAGQIAGRDFIEPFWEEMVRSTIFETAHWAGHGTTERSHAAATSPLTKEWRVVATGDWV